MTRPAQPFVPPPYPYDRLNDLKAEILAHHDSLVDLSVGTPFDDPPRAVVEALSASGAERAYPPSVGTPGFHDAVLRWLDRGFSVQVSREQVGATVGSKEFVALLPQFMALRTPSKDTVLYPAISYPSYEMGATLAGLRAVAVPFRADGAGLDLDAVSQSDRDRALLLWVNSPGNPTGHVEDLGCAADFGRRHGIPVFSDECYIEFTWDGPGHTILEHGTEGVIAVHSLSKRSNFAGARAGFYVGDAEIVHYLREVRKHAGLMVPGPVQAAAIVALDDDAHVALQRDRYARRLEQMADVLGEWSGRRVDRPAGAFYLWVPVEDAWEFTRSLAHDAGALVSPGDFYATGETGHVRIAVVQPDDQIDLVAERLRASTKS